MPPPPLQSGISTEGQMKLWERAALGDDSMWGTDGALVQSLETWGSGVDFPFSSFPAEMVEQYPEAK